MPDLPHVVASLAYMAAMAIGAFIMRFLIDLAMALLIKIFGTGKKFDSYDWSWIALGFVGMEVFRDLLHGLLPYPIAVSALLLLLCAVFTGRGK